MRKKFVQSVTENHVPFAILVDESTTLSKKTCLDIYIRCSIGDAKPYSFFLDLIELPGTSATDITKALLACLRKHKFTDSILKDYWLALGTDGASVMVGRKAGVIAKLKETYPNLIGWHCMNHRLELSVHDVVKSITDINHIKSFMDKLYTLYHRSPKAKRELDVCAAELGSVVYKIGRVLDVRWSASSCRTVRAVWRSYESLHRHFLTASTDLLNDSKDRAMYIGLLKKLTNPVFLKNLALLYDALEELSDLSEGLQKADISMAAANRKIQRQIDVFSSRKENPGCYYKEAIAAITAGNFCGVPLTREGKSEREINCKQLYQGLVDSMTQRLMSDDDKEFRDWVAITEADRYQSPFTPDHGEAELRKLCYRFKLPFTEVKDAFREFKDSKGKTVKSEFQKLLFAVDTIPVSTAACERGFSVMNDICTPTRSLLTVPHMSSIMFIHIIGPPVIMWKPQHYVRTWLAKDRRDATSLKGMARDAKIQDDASQETLCTLWKIM
jgi:hypothetical protein